MYECFKQKTMQLLRKTDQWFLLSTQAKHETSNIVREDYIKKL